MMSHWRRLAIAAISNSIRPHMGQERRFIRSIEFAPADEKDAAVNERLEAMLLRAASAVPYYSRVLKEARVVEGGRVRLENFAAIPFLTKEIVRREGERLWARDRGARHAYETSSGGSTGEPVTRLMVRI
jgi:phenylacetate-CoA ligase